MKLVRVRKIERSKTKADSAKGEEKLNRFIPCKAEEEYV
jgi:hypothetical protein